MSKNQGGSEPSVRTWDLLRGIGFEPDPGIPSDPPGALGGRVGDLPLTGIHCVSPRDGPIVAISGIRRESGTITEVAFDLPQGFESREVGIAWVAWQLDHHAGESFRSTTHEPWLDEARALRHLLPWVREKQTWEARPVCKVQRYLLKPALHHLTESLKRTSTEARVSIGFDGEALSFRVAGRLTVVPAEGIAWDAVWSIPSENLQPPPRRLMKARVLVEIWEGHLSIGGRAYRGIERIATRPDGTSDVVRGTRA